MADNSALALRVDQVLASARFATFATVSSSGQPWSWTVAYAVETPRKSLVFYSSREAEHSQHLAQGSRASGSAFIVEPALDGIQFNCSISEVVEDVDAVHDFYYASMFPDAEERERWMMPIESFVDHAIHRFYRVAIERFWLIDNERWDSDKVDSRVEVEVPKR